MNSNDWNEGISPRFDWQLMLEEAKSLNAMKPWELVEDSQVFVIKDPLTNNYLYCSILGAGGIEFGMAVYIGHEGLNALHLIGTGDSMDEILFKQRSVLLSFVDRDELEPAEYAFLKKHNVSFRGRKQWVQLTSFVPGKYPWFLDEEEGRILLLAIKQTKEMLHEVKNGINLRKFKGGDEFTARVLLDDATTVNWKTVELNSSTADNPNSTTSLAIDEVTLKRLSKAPFATQPIIFDWFFLETPVQNDPTSRPFFPALAVVLSEEDGSIIWQDMIEDHSASSIQQTFVWVLENLGHLPESITLNKNIEAQLAPLLQQLPLTINVTEFIPAVEELRAYMRHMSQWD